MQDTIVNEGDLFIASGLPSIEDFLKTAISKHKYIHCTFPLMGKLSLCSTLVRALNEQNIQWIHFPNTGRLYPPHFNLAG